MMTNLATTAICAVGLDSGLLDGLKSERIASVKCGDLDSAIAGVQTSTCRLIVMAQPDSWSLDRTGREVSSRLGDGSTIALSPNSSSFTPGLYVVDDHISPVALARLIERVLR